MKKSEILDRVYKAVLPSNAKNIMFYLVNRANAEGTCFPSVRTIAKEYGMSERTVQRMMAVLVEQKFVIKKSRFRDLGGQTSNLYCLDIEVMEEMNGEEIEEEWNSGESFENCIEQNNDYEIMGSEFVSWGDEMVKVAFDFYQPLKGMESLLSTGRKVENDCINMGLEPCVGINYACKTG